MSQASVRTAIYNAVNGVANIGVCHNRLRWATDAPGISALFKATIGGVDQLRGAMVSLRAIDPIDNDFAGDQWRALTFQVDMYRNVDDSLSSESEFAVLVELVVNTLDNAATLDAFYEHRTATAAIDERVFGNILCHHAAITEVVVEGI